MYLLCVYHVYYQGLNKKLFDLLKNVDRLHIVDY